MRGGRLSYRRRRLMVALSSVLLLGGGVTAAILLLPTAQPPDREPAGPLVSAASAQDSSEGPTSRPARISKAESRRIASSLSLFVKSAVRRDHPERSWAVVHPVLRAGLTRRQWSTGNIPVVPFPAVGIGLLAFESLVGDTALVDIMLVPEARTHLVRKTFTAELRRVAGPVGERWLVSSWVPAGVSLSQMNMDAPAEPAAAEVSQTPHLSAIWLVIPIGALLGGIILIPAFVFARESYRARRAEARLDSDRPSAHRLAG